MVPFNFTRKPGLSRKHPARAKLRNAPGRGQLSSNMTTAAQAWTKIFHPAAVKATFCEECGTLLQLPAKGLIMTCDLCGRAVDLTGTLSLYSNNQKQSNRKEPLLPRVNPRRPWWKTRMIPKQPRYELRHMLILFFPLFSSPPSTLAH